MYIREERRGEERREERREKEERGGEERERKTMYTPNTREHADAHTDVLADLSMHSFGKHVQYVHIYTRNTDM